MGQGELVHASIFPHPPIMVPAVGSAPADLEKNRPTREATQRLAAEIAALRPDTVLIITPHGPLHPRAMGMMANPRLYGDLAYFRAGDVTFECSNDPLLGQELKTAALEASVPLLALDEYQAARLDHGVVVPWYFLAEAGISNTLVPITYSYLPLETHWAFGRAIGRAIAASGRRVAVVASGDLSHRLLPTAPAGYNPRGKDFDRIVVEAAGRGDWQTIRTIDPDLMEAAGECGYRSMMILSGLLEGRQYASAVYSYAAPYGVGYLVAAFPPQSDAGGSGQGPHLSGPADLARQAVETWVRLGTALPPPPVLPAPWQRQAGVFVTIRDGDTLRGCIGTFRPTHANLCVEILRNAVLAATQDPRFPPIQAEELSQLNYHVNILNALQPAAGPEDLDPQRYGVLVRAGGRQGLLLPNLPQICTVPEQLAQVRLKAGIGPQEPVELFRFTTTEYGEGEKMREEG